MKVVYPGDKVDIEVWEYHEGSSGFGTTSTPLTTLITMVSGVFGGVSGGGGESGLIYNGVNAAINAFAPGGNLGTDRPAAYLNYILFDESYNLIDMGWQPAPATTFTKQNLSFNTLDIEQAGYLFVYLSYDNDSNNWVYFDDFKVTHTPSNVIQYNEYYPFGLQTSSSWTRENNSNNFLYNAGNELNENSGWYETFFRGYDPALGRFNQVDPVAFASSSLTPYNYGFNDPVFYNDPMGDYPPGTCCSGGGGGGYAIDSDLDFNGNPLPGYVPTGGGYSSGYGGGPGSGNHWSDPYRSTYGNWMLMSSTTFNSYYGITDQYGFTDEERKSQIASQMGSSAYWVTTDEGNFIYTDKSFQQLEGWYRAQYMGSGQTQGCPTCNIYKEGSYDESYRGSRGLPHLTLAQGAYVVDASYSVYKDSDGKYQLKFFGTVQHYAQSLGESFFTAQTRLIVNGKPVGPTLTADFRPGESVIIPAGLVALGFTSHALPDAGRVQLQLTINSYFKDGQHPGVDISRDSWYFNVPVMPTIGPK